ncbi:MAG: sulfur carrier protein ThiS [Bacteroidales bacterium]
MKIILNNRDEEFEGNSLSVAEMLEVRKFTYRMRIIKINGVLIPRESYADTFIKEGDNVQMLYLMSGG